MNKFLSTSTDGALLKDYYPAKDPMSLLQDALKRRRRRRMSNREGMEPPDLEQINSANMGYSRGLL